MHIQGNAFIALGLHQVGVFISFAVLHKGQPDHCIRGNVLPGDHVLLELFKIAGIDIRAVVGNEIQLDITLSIFVHPIPAQGSVPKGGHVSAHIIAHIPGVFVRRSLDGDHFRLHRFAVLFSVQPPRQQINGLDALIVHQVIVFLTGYLPMTNKQTPALTTEQWSEIAKLCEEYIQYADRKAEQLDMSIVMLRMIYIWCFTRNKDEFEQLRDRQGLLRGNEWYFEKICICNPGTSEPKQFIINLIKNRSSNKNEYIATIADSVDAMKRGGKRDAIESIIVGSTQKPLHVPARIKEILLNGRKGQDVFKLDQPVVVWFNAKGPQIGLPGTKGGRQ